MSLDPTIFQKLTRAEIQKVFGPLPRAVRSYEQLQEALSSDIIGAINQAEADAAAAKAAADAAQADADAANAEIIVINSKLPWPNMVFVNSLADLPSPVSGVIVLSDNATYFITNVVDLAGNRLLCGQNTVLIGGSSENCRIKSTGLVGTALITSQYSLPIRNLTIEADTALDLDGDGVTTAIDWFGVNFTDCANVGTIKNYSNVIFSDCAILNSANLVFDGTIGTVGIAQSLLSGIAGETTVSIASTAVITRRFRIVYSAVFTPASGTGIDADVSATIPTESYILDTVNFSGPGTPLAGFDQTYNESLFEKNKGISNTFVNGQMYMRNNATATTIAAPSTFYKAAGTTTASANNSRFTHTSNRLECDAVISRRFLVVCTLSFSSTAGNVCEFGLYLSSAASVSAQSTVPATANAAGRAENVTFQDVISLSDGDYIEVHCANTSGSNNITVSDLNLTITEI